MPKLLWKVGDRLRHSETDQLATVTEFYEDDFFDSGYFARIEYDEPIMVTQVYGNWRTMRAEWIVVKPEEIPH